MKSLLVSALLFMLLSSLKPGERSATLTCGSASGRTLFLAELPECNYFGNAKFSIDNSKLNFGIGVHSSIIFDAENKVFTIAPESKDEKKFLKFWGDTNNDKKDKIPKRSGLIFS